MNQEWIYRILKRDEVTPKDITINYNTPSKIELILHANKYEMMMRMFWERTNVTYKIERQFMLVIGIEVVVWRNMLLIVQV